MLANLSCIIDNGVPVPVIQNLSVPAVVEMHTQSSLWEQIPDRGESLDEAEAALLTFLSKWVEPGESPMCGSTVSFDRSFLREHMPKLEKYFHYRNIDVSTVKELARLWNKPAFDMRPDDGYKAHRAYADIKASIEELRHYRRAFLKNDMIVCENCEKEFDPIQTRWLCPFCGRKHHCCEGD